MERESIEVTGADIETALEHGLALLGVERDAVEVEVLEAPSRGVFGIGAHPARLRLTVKPAAPPQAEAPSAPRTEEGAAPTEAPAEAPAPPPPPAEGQRARSALVEILRRAGFRNARVALGWTDPDPVTAERALLLDAQAPGLERLVGARGEGLEALQYLVRLIALKGCEHPVRLLVDLNGHKRRRRRALVQLAQRLAQQAVETHRTVVLEPMPPDERRVIHLALRDHPRVRTESVGVGERRKVTIIPRD